MPVTQIGQNRIFRRNIEAYVHADYIHRFPFGYIIKHVLRCPTWNPTFGRSLFKSMAYDHVKRKIFRIWVLCRMSDVTFWILHDALANRSGFSCLEQFHSQVKHKWQNENLSSDCWLFVRKKKMFRRVRSQRQGFIFPWHKKFSCIVCLLGDLNHCSPYQNWNPICPFMSFRDMHLTLFLRRIIEPIANQFRNQRQTFCTF